MKRWHKRISLTGGERTTCPFWGFPLSANSPPGGIPLLRVSGFSSSSDSSSFCERDDYDHVDDDYYDDVDNDDTVASAAAADGDDDDNDLPWPGCSPVVSWGIQKHSRREQAHRWPGWHIPSPELWSAWTSWVWIWTECSNIVPLGLNSLFMYWTYILLIHSYSFVGHETSVVQNHVFVSTWNITNTLRVKNQQ